MFDAESQLLEKIRLGEDSLLELKEIVFSGSKIKGPTREKLANEFAAFANSEKGGVLLLGVTDDPREPQGMTIDQLEKLEKLACEISSDNIEPSLVPVIQKLSLPDNFGNRQPVLRIDISRSLFVHRSPGGYFYRLGDRAVLMKTSYLERLMQQRSQSGLILYDETAVPGTSPEALTVRLAERFIEGVDPEEALEYFHKLLLITKDSQGEMRCTVAGALMASARPDQLLHSGAAIEFVHYGGQIQDSDQQLDARRIVGPLDEQILEAFRAVRTALPREASKHPAREEKETFSERAIFESIVNAVVHRDYSIAGSRIRIFLFSDRLEISSPGALPNTLGIDSLAHRQYTRNETVVGLLNRLSFELDQPDSPFKRGKFMEERGEGVPIVFRESKRLKSQEPSYEIFDNSEVRLTIWSAD